MRYQRSYCSLPYLRRDYYTGSMSRGDTTGISTRHSITSATARTDTANTLDNVRPFGKSDTSKHKYRKRAADLGTNIIGSSKSDEHNTKRQKVSTTNTTLFDI